MANDEDDNSERAKRQGRRLKAVLFGALIGGGALEMAGWNAQAHGNRSSHKAATLSWAANDFVFERERMFNAEDPTTRALLSLQARSESLKRTAPFAGTRTTKEIGAADEALTTMQNEMLLTPVTARVMGLLKSGDVEGAAKVIEGEGSPEDVLSAYTLVQLDLHNLSFVDGRSTPAYADEILQISKAAIAYGESQSSQDAKSYLAGIHHNLASFSLPDIGAGSEEIRTAGAASAEAALMLREELGDPVTIRRAHLMVGLHASDRGDVGTALQAFTTAEKMARKAGDKTDIAWSLLYRSRVAVTEAPLNKKGKPPKRLAKALEEAQTLFEEVGDDQGLLKLQELKAN